jgi:hypothetical protein
MTGIIAMSWYWIPAIYGTVLTIGENKADIETVRLSVVELTETLGGMAQIFGNAEILENGTTLSVSVNIHSDAGRWSRPGQQLQVINTGDRREMSVIVTVEGKFEGEPHLFLTMSRAAGRAIGANPGDQIQVAVQAADEKRGD